MSTLKDHLGQKRRFVENSWSAKASSRITAHRGAGRSVHRIKVDENAGYILTTSYVGGLTVTDLKTSQNLWTLPDSHVRPYAHCEYGAGFVIFDYIDGSKEVWRRVDDFRDEEPPVIRESLPTQRQWRVSATAERKYATASTKRGHFRPWASLHPPQITRAFRFSYPILGAAAWDAVYLWDVRTGVLVQTIETIQLGPADDEDDHNLVFLGDINYIEVSEKYVFLCGIHSLRVFSRETGKSVLDFSASRIPIAASHFSISPDRPVVEVEGASLVLQNLNRAVLPSEHPYIIVDEFIAGQLPISYNYFDAN
ncbi:hypothetical protein H0H81_003991 [Sphagnurus paluster]|uniref:Uncharacterized protein n=1 Tax=Sphagnurus paluster TaxID=117069 RepID=A0A9P7FYK7_9AGAR|nr:hypothetical protein H0H81_003991 [Sphagnurus paluster]